MLEVPHTWRRRPECLPYMQKRPYGYTVGRCYTLDSATLLFAEK